MPQPLRDRDMSFFESEFVKAVPAVKGRESTYFAIGNDGVYLNPEARLGLLCFKLGGNYVVSSMQTFLTR